MTTEPFDQTFSDGLARALSAAASKPEPRPLSKRRWLLVGVIAAAVALGAAGTAVAASIWSVPGAPAYVPLQAPKTSVHTGSAQLSLSHVPAGTTHLHLAIRCESAGTLTFPDGASISCGPSDVGTPSGDSSYNLPLARGVSVVSIQASVGMVWAVTQTLESADVTKWGVNSNGQTYGAQNAEGTPDLMAVVATNGKYGYVVASQLAEADGDTASAAFTSPGDALKWAASHRGDVSSINVYKSDGKTKVGVFDVQQ